MRILTFFMCITLIILLGTGCTDTEQEMETITDSPLPPSPNIANDQDVELDPPVPLSEEIIQNMDWTLTGTFVTNGFEMRGHQNRVGFIENYSFKAGQANKYMWHFWGDVARKELVVMALKKGEKTPIPVLSIEGDTTMWSIGTLGGKNNGADAHIRSSLGLPEPGIWALVIFLDNEHFDNIIIEVQ